jgi:hypothetical protein
MTYVWIQESAGSMRYVDDIYLPPCNKCGERKSVCQANGCIKKLGKKDK